MYTVRKLLTRLTREPRREPFGVGGAGGYFSYLLVVVHMECTMQRYGDGVLVFLYI